MSVHNQSASFPDLLSAQSNELQDVPVGNNLNAVRHQWLQQQHQLLLAAWQRARKLQSMAAIHDTRVAARRLRTVLRTWRKELHPLLYAELKFHLRDVGRLLAAAREADVRRRQLASLMRPVPEELNRSANLLLAQLDQARATERRALREKTHHSSWLTKLSRIQACIDSEQLLAMPRTNASFTSELQQFDVDWRKLRKACAKKRIATSQLHLLRIKVKNLRYIGEALGELSGRDLEPQLKLLKQLQDLLGNLHDSLQLEAWCSSGIADAQLKSLLEKRLTERWEQLRRQYVGLRLKQPARDASGSHS